MAEVHWSETMQVGKTLVSAEQIQHRIEELGEQITKDYQDDPPLLVAVLKGAFVLLADLCRAIKLPVTLDYMAVASYGMAHQSSGIVRILKDLDVSLKGRHVLVVEDIVDSGLTLHYLLRTLRMREPASLEVCAFLVKPQMQRVELPLKYVGFEIGNEFVIGYGLDAAGRFRQLPQVAVADGVPE